MFSTLKHAVRRTRYSCDVYVMSDQVTCPYITTSCAQGGSHCVACCLHMSQKHWMLHAVLYVLTRKAGPLSKGPWQAVQSADGDSLFGEGAPYTRDRRLTAGTTSSFSARRSSRGLLGPPAWTSSSSLHPAWPLSRQWLWTQASRMLPIARARVLTYSTRRSCTAVLQQTSSLGPSQSLPCEWQMCMRHISSTCRSCIYIHSIRQSSQQTIVLAPLPHDATNLLDLQCN